MVPDLLFLHVDLVPLNLAGRVSRCETRDDGLNLCLTGQHGKGKLNERLMQLAP